MRRYFVLLFAYSVMVGIQHRERSQPVPLPNSVIPDAETAAKVAEAILVPIYGAERIEKERPLRAELHGDTWTVVGTAKNMLYGGSATLEISKSKGCIISISHGK